MINKPTVAELLNKADNRYRLVIATAKRARQLVLGSHTISTVTDSSPVTQAAIEIDEGTLKVYDQNGWDELEEKRATEGYELKVLNLLPKDEAKS